MKFAVISLAGSQYQVEEGTVFSTSRLPQKQGEKITPTVLLFQDGEKLAIGQPELKDIQVNIEIVEHHRGSKIRAATYKAKSKNRRVKGFKPSLTKLKVISIKNQELKEKEKPKKEEKIKKTKK